MWAVNQRVTENKVLIRYEECLLDWRTMPNKPARPCNVPNCPNLVRGRVGYCPEHIHESPSGWAAKKDRSHQKIYHTARWRRTSEQYRKEHPICIECKENGLIEQVDVVDHIVPIQNGGAVFDWDNLQSLCNSCHNSKTAKENASKKT